MSYLDGLVVFSYFAIVLGIGVALRRRIRSSADFFLAGRSIPAWVAGLAFLSANLGAQEVMGMAASGAKYGIATSHFYWLGAIPAMVFLGVFMMPFYYGSRARSVPEYLRLRFDEKTRAFNALTFAFMTIFSSGISMYALARLVQTLHILDRAFVQLGLPISWIFHASILISAVIVLAYVLLGGLTSAIYNEVLQFFLIVAGFLPLVYLGLQDVGGWSAIRSKLPEAYTHAWAGMGSSATNPLGVEWFGLVMGLGFVLSFGYWCTDFLVVQRAMAAHSMPAARRAPLIAAVPKMLFPFLVILPGLIAVSLPNQHPSRTPASLSITAPQDVAYTSARGLIPAKRDNVTGRLVLDSNGRPIIDYDLVIPVMLLHYFPAGMLGLGVTALLASFMSGMAGNVTAFNTVWTYDIYQTHIHRGAADAHYLYVGRLATVLGIGASVLAAYLATRFNNIMDLLQLVFAFVNAPLFATFLLGMFWKRSTGDGAFAGMIAGTLGAAVHHALTLPQGAAVGIKGGWLGIVHLYRSEMAQNFWTAIFAWTVCLLVTVLVSLCTKPPDARDLIGLVYSLTARPEEDRGSWFQRPAAVGVAVLAAAAVLNLIFR